MKKTIFILLSLFLLAAPTALQAQFGVSTNADGTLTITNYTGPGGDVTIPTTINGQTVTGLGSNVMVFNTNVTSVTIPGSITNIAGNTFYMCQGLTNAVLGNGIQNIPEMMFVACRNLASVTIPDSVTNIGSTAFWISGLTSVTIPVGVVSISGAFIGCADLTNVILPPGLVDIGDAFNGCSRLSAIAIPSSVSNIGSYTFYQCTNLGSIVLTNGCAVIGDYAFESCSSLTNLSFPASLVSIGDYSFYGCPLTSLAIPSGVTNIGVDSFYQCQTLTNLTIAGVANIQSNAFFNCTNLANVSIAGGVIGWEAFLGCSSSTPPFLPQPPPTGLTNLILGNGVTSIGDDAFGSAFITRIFIPNSVTYIAPGAFTECPYLTNVIIGAGVTDMEEISFAECYALTNILFLGNAPNVPCGGNQPVFYGAPGTVYYLPGTTGWSNTFGGYPFGPPNGAPTALWNPTIQNGAVSNGQFGFNITGTANIPIVVEACTNLANPVWTPLQSMTLTNGLVYFSDSTWTSFPVRYYGIGFP